MNSSLARSLLLPPTSSASSSSLWSLFTHSYLVSIELFENLNRNVSPVPKYLCRMPKYDNFIYIACCMFKKIEDSTYLYHLSDFSEPKLLSNMLQTPLRV